MTSNEFISTMAVLVAAFPTAKVSDQTIEVYRTKFQDLTADQFKELVSRAMDECDRFPTVSELRKLAGKDTRSSGIQAFQFCLNIRQKALEEPGPYGTDTHRRKSKDQLHGWDGERGDIYFWPEEVLADPRLEAAIDQIGGWQKFCEKDFTDFTRKTFIETWVSFNSVATKPALAPADHPALGKPND